MTQQDRIDMASIHQKGGRPRHYNGTVGETAVTINIDPSVERLIFSNPNPSKDLYISFDSGTNFFTIYELGSFSIDRCSVRSVQLKGSALLCDYEILGW